MIRMPGKSFSEKLAPLDARERAIRASLERHVRVIGEEIGERHLLGRKDQLDRTADYIEAELRKADYDVESHWYEVSGDRVRNLDVLLRGRSRPEQYVVVGAHYDSAEDSPGANDNGSAVAAVLELARIMRNDEPARSVRFVAFVNEEPPWFQTDDMGSLRYARACRERGDDITAMLSIETIGYYSDEPGSQQYPPPLSLAYPERGDFIGFVGNVGSNGLVRRCVELFRERCEFPSEGAALPSFLPGIGWSDHWAFWQVGYRGVMVTDTALFRYPHYHTPQKKKKKIDFDRTARVVSGLLDVVRALADE
ncbi:MAG: M28 family peptidase [Deltaproteobacteria bacterium]|nr:M28 family peptidase [Deltaproteobacteria bacterium]